MQNLRSARLRSSQTEFLTYGRVLDTKRMRTELRFAPRFSTSETLDDFVERSGVSPVIAPDTWRKAERQVVSAAHRLA